MKKVLKTWIIKIRVENKRPYHQIEIITLFVMTIGNCILIFALFFFFFFSFFFSDLKSSEDCGFAEKHTIE